MTIYQTDGRTEAPPAIDLGAIAAVIFDADGVVTDTARVHAQAWKQVFDPFLRARTGKSTEEFRPFDVRDDYLTFVDGKPRPDGVRGFLESRGIAPSKADLCSLSARKDRCFVQEMHRHGVAAFPTTVALVRELRRCGERTAVVSASVHCAEVLRTAGIVDMFDLSIDGVDAARLGLAGKPDPALFLEAARRLGVAPAETAVVEDALAGIEAGKRGGFGLVLGVDRRGQASALYAHSADAVVSDLAEVWITGRRRKP